MLLGALAVLGNVLMGWGAYTSTRRVVLNGVLAENMGIARHLAAEMDEMEESLPLDPGTLDALRGHWESTESLFAGTLQVMGDDGTLLFDSHAVPNSPIDIGSHPLGGGTHSTETLRDLARAHGEWMGVRTDSMGREEATVYAPASRLGALVSIQVPYHAVTTEALDASLPWMIGLLAVSLGIGPLALVLLRHAYASSEAEATEAGGVVARYAARLRLLQQVDRALLEQGTVADVAGAALGSIKAAIPVEGALVESTAADGTAQTIATEGTTAPLEPGEPLIHVPLRAGDTAVGMLHLRFRRDAALSPEDRSAVNEISDALAMALYQARLHRTIATQNAVLGERVAHRTAQLEAAIQELDSFAYTIAHDLRAPLRALTGLADIVLADNAAVLGDESKAQLERIGRAGARLDRLVLDLLEYSRIGRAAFHPAPVALDAVVDEALAHVEPHRAGAHGEIRVERPLPTVMGDQDALAGVVEHLLDNALTFVAPGQPPRVRIGAERMGARVLLRVEDEGIGIATEHQERIFRVFERLHGPERYPGTGVGLAIVQRTVQALGGSVTVRSQPGRGSSFRLELDAVEGA